MPKKYSNEEERKAAAAARKRIARANQSDSEREANKARLRLARANQTADQRAAEAMRKRIARSNQSDEQRNAEAERKRIARANRSGSEREANKARLRIARANQTADQRAPEAMRKGIARSSQSDEQRNAEAKRKRSARANQSDSEREANSPRLRLARATQTSDQGAAEAMQKISRSTQSDEQRENSVDMDLTESMKNLVGKGLLGDMGPPSSGSGFAGSGYVTEKLYMLLQLYLQNKGWNPSVELLQCFSELKEASMLPSAAYLQMMAQRITLDSQGRLVLRENGKIILPCEHFGNAVMLKHMNGPQGMHLGLEATIRAVMDSYTIGREQFGMEKEFIIDIVQNCPNGACRYYKNQLELSHRSLAHLSGTPGYLDSKKGKSSSSRDSDQRSTFGSDDFGVSHHHQSCTTPVDLTPSDKTSKSNSSSSQSRAQLLSAVQQMVGGDSKTSSLSKSSKSHHIEPSPQDHKIADFLRANLETLEGLGLTSSNKDLLALHNGAWGGHDNESKRLSGAVGEVGQEKIVRAFTEIMKNMARMKTCIRPAMCKPYGKQSESLQKTLMDTVQLVQSLRQVLPPPHIAVSSWKNEDKHSDPTRKLD